MIGTDLTIVYETKGKRVRLPFPVIHKLKTKILGPKYQLSLIIVGDARSRALNRTYRKKDKPTNILSFSINKNEGELYLNLKQVKREEKLFDRTFQNLALFLLIHGMFHLKGAVHGSKMEAKEKAVRSAFSI